MPFVSQLFFYETFLKNKNVNLKDLSSTKFSYYYPNNKILKLMALGANYILMFPSKRIFVFNKYLYYKLLDNFFILNSFSKNKLVINYYKMTSYFIVK